MTRTALRSGLALALTVAAAAALAQRDAYTAWYLEEVGPEDATLSASVETGSGDFVAFGTKEDGSGHFDLWAIRYDADGNVVWNKTISKTGAAGNVYFDGAVATPTGGFAVLTGVTGNATDVDIWVLLLDGDGNVVDERTIDEHDADGPGLLRIGPAGNLVFANSVYSVGPATVYKLDTSLNTLWTTQVGIAGQDEQYVEDMAITQVNDVIVATHIDDGVQEDIRVQRLDGATGNSVYTRDFGDPVEEDYYAYVLASEAGPVYFHYLRGAFGPSPEGKLIRLDQSGNSTWTMSSGNVTMQGMRELSNGDFVVCGTRYNGGVSVDQVFRRFDADGNVLWTSFFSRPELVHDWFRKLDVGDDDNVCAIAHCSTPDPGSDWLVTMVTPDGALVFNKRLNSGPNETYDFPGGIHVLDDGAAIVVGETGDTLDDDAVAIRLQAQFTVLPDTATVKLGRLNAGNLASLWFDDNLVYEVCKFVVPNQSTPPVNVEVEGTVPTDYPTGSVTFEVSSSATTTGVSQNVELWDWTTSTWVNSTVTAMGLSEAKVFVTGTAANVVQAGTGRVRARMRISVTGLVLTSSWCGRFDQAVWRVEP